MRRFFIKLLSWEYWPQWIVYMPLGFYYLYLSARARSLFFFSAANPGIETGGMFFESKWDVFQLIPEHLYPTTVQIGEKESIEQVARRIEAAGIAFPLIAKPDRGERGWGVQKINSVSELAEYREKNRVTFLIQAYVDYPVELSIFYVRHPHTDKGVISSVTYKKLLSIIGDGHSSVRDLILSADRAYLQKNVLFKQFASRLADVLVDGEELILVPYGNHVRGAEFKDYRAIIDDELLTTFDSICRQIPGFYYGRFDLRVKSLDDLKKGEHIAIMELNGAGAEPAHIYDPRFSFLKAQSDILWHYRRMFEIAMHNKQQGSAFMTMNEYRRLKVEEKAYKKRAA